MRRTLDAARIRSADPFLRSVFGSLVLLGLIRWAEPLLFHSGYYAELAVHPFWIVVILASIQEGLFVGVATAGLASLLMQWPPRPLDMDITAHYAAVAIVPIQWILSAALLGAYRQIQIVAEDRVRKENAALQDANNLLEAEVRRLDAAIFQLELDAATRTSEPESWTERVREMAARNTDRPGAAFAPWREAADRLVSFGATDHGPALLRALAEAEPGSGPMMVPVEEGRIHALCQALGRGSPGRPGWIAIVLDGAEPGPGEAERLTRLALQIEAEECLAAPPVEVAEANDNVIPIQARHGR